MTIKLKKLIHMGPGGMNCPCCFPGPNTPARRKIMRTAKKIHARMDLQEREEEMMMKYVCADCGADTWKSGVEIDEFTTICHKCNRRRYEEHGIGANFMDC